MALDLMPVSTEAPRCSDFARSIALLPRGSGLFLERVVLVSVPLPWPKPALKHPLLAESAPLVAGSAVRTRLFACEPTTTGATTTMVEVFERQGSAAAVYRWNVAGDEIPQLIERIAGTDLGALGSFGEQLDAGATFLVCTQGSHDSCCGTSGVALADEIETRRPDIALRRVSHTGGHRFSPTFLAFPEGRMWAFADIDLVDRIAADTTTAEDHERSARGWWGAKVGPAQVAECAVRARSVDKVFTEPTISEVERPAEDPVRTFTVSVDDDVWTVDVRIGREVPSISCETPGGLPAKPGREFSYVIERS